MTVLVWFCFLSRIFNVTALVLHTENAEERLFKYLFHEGDMVNTRPVSNISNPVPLTFGMSLNQIIGVDEKNEALALSVWIRQMWKTDTLAWNPKDFDGITMINVQPSKMWVPDIVLYNSVDENKVYGSTFDKLETRIRLNNKGEIVWLAPVILKSRCKIDVKDFPFDTQICYLKFSSWTYGGEHLNLLAESNKLDTAMYNGSSEWALADTSVARNEVKYYCCPIPWPDVTFTLVLKRRSLFYMVNLIMPMVAIGILALLSFSLPVESGERMTVSVTVLLALTVFMFFVTETIPPTSDGVPLVGAFFTTMLIVLVIVIFVLCYVIRIHHMTEHDPPMPLWMRWYIYDGLAYTIGIRACSIKDKYKNKESLRKLNWFLPTVRKFESKGLSAQCSNNVDKLHDKQVSSTEPTKNIRKLPCSRRKLSNENDWEIVRNEWRICAKTFDKICYVFFIIVFFVTMIVCYLKSPGYVP